MLIYSPEGVEFDKEPVDVRELVEQGWSREAPKVAVAETPAVVVAEAPEEDTPRRGRPSKFGNTDI